MSSSRRRVGATIVIIVLTALTLLFLVLAANKGRWSKTTEPTQKVPATFWGLQQVETNNIRLKYSSSEFKAAYAVDMGPGDVDQLKSAGMGVSACIGLECIILVLMLTFSLLIFPLRRHAALHVGAPICSVLSFIFTTCVFGIWSNKGHPALDGIATHFKGSKSYDSCFWLAVSAWVFALVVEALVIYVYWTRDSADDGLEYRPTADYETSGEYGATTKT